MTLGEALVLAVSTAIATTLIAEGVRALRRYLDRRQRVADWSIRVFPPVRGLLGRFFVIENVGDADALDVHVTIGGEAEYEVNAGVALDVLRPHDTFVVLVHRVGTGSVQIAWNDRQGKARGPARRALLPE